MPLATPTRQRLRTLGVIASIGAVLTFVPERPRPVPQRPDGQPFVWDQDSMWEGLRARFEASTEVGCDPDFEAGIERLRAQAVRLGETMAAPDAEGWGRAEQDFFEFAADLGGCPERFTALLTARNALWSAAKRASVSWPETRTARDRLYRVLYGTRAATEEVLLQLPAQYAPGVNNVADIASSTPSVEIEGVRIHSGDLLVSRGGAPTSAFIARGNDYPGNFSHVALVHVNEAGVAQVIEAHIERGVAIATPEAYFADKKLRVLVLRMRPDHAKLRASPLLPHQVATAALRDATTRHIPYDFPMDFADPQRQFCSEVASANYRSFGVELWPTLSSFSSPGLARWMAALGVEHLQTHSPSDLEYDPQLAVVAEWHDAGTLLDDHVDNAIIDAMLEGAERGDPLRYDLGKLPLARAAKAYSAVLNLFGGEGPVPEGMSATVALRATWLAERHAALKTEVLAAVRSQQARGRTPAYWELVALARAARAD